MMDSVAHLFDRAARGVDALGPPRCAGLDELTGNGGGAGRVFGGLGQVVGGGARRAGGLPLLGDHCAHAADVVGRERHARAVGGASDRPSPGTRGRAIIRT